MAVDRRFIIEKLRHINGCVVVYSPAFATARTAARSSKTNVVFIFKVHCGATESTHKTQGCQRVVKTVVLQKVAKVVSIVNQNVVTRIPQFWY